MWKAVLIGGGVMLPPLGEYSEWQAALARCLEHMGLIAPGWYRLEEVGVDQVGDMVVAFVILTHSRGKRWILNAVAPVGGFLDSAPPTVGEVEVFLKTWGFGEPLWGFPPSRR